MLYSAIHINCSEVICYDFKHMKYVFFCREQCQVQSSSCLTDSKEQTRVFGMYRLTIQNTINRGILIDNSPGNDSYDHGIL